METNLSFSFVIPVYNVEKYLQECVESIIKQTYQWFEIILVDDGSTDSSSKICDELKQKDSRISVIHQQNQGLSGARNTGIINAKNDFIIFLDSDDYWLYNGALKTIADCIEKNNADLIIWNSIKFLDGNTIAIENARFINYSERKYEPKNEIINEYVYRACAWDKAIKTEIIKKNNLNFKIGDISEDVEWCADLLSLVDSFTYLGMPINAYRQRLGSITKFNPDKSVPFVLKHLEYLKSKCSNQTILGKNILAYTAEQYVNLLCIIGNSTTYSVNKQQLKKFSYVLKYGYSSRCKVVRFFIRGLSFDCTVYLLKIIRNLKGRKF